MNRREWPSNLGVVGLAIGPVALGIATGIGRPPLRDDLPDELNAADYRKYFTPDEDVEVTLNGAKLRACVRANRAEGWADVITGVDDNRVRIERHHGRVAFRRIAAPNLSEPQGGPPWRV